ncbi:hypothetical protein E2C01_033110 [Portunus trituberculatus]|uniref:Uncharacterized protein n=1 Tax=Portunus trituberculatus TaxID=210409 RepID=A0A5B7EWZ5_PORTR|nr:hypothetical protein [Portunus trituberculatus]
MTQSHHRQVTPSRGVTLVPRGRCRGSRATHIDVCPTAPPPPRPSPPSTPGFVIVMSYLTGSSRAQRQLQALH